MTAVAHGDVERRVPGELLDPGEVNVDGDREASLDGARAGAVAA